jgi:hypothetical protein
MKNYMWKAPEIRFCQREIIGKLLNKNYGAAYEDQDEDKNGNGGGVVGAPLPHTSLHLRTKTDTVFKTLCFLEYQTMESPKTQWSRGQKADHKERHRSSIRCQ